MYEQITPYFNFFKLTVQIMNFTSFSWTKLSISHGNSQIIDDSHKMCQTKIKSISYLCTYFALIRSISYRPSQQKIKIKNFDILTISQVALYFYRFSTYQNTYISDNFASGIFIIFLFCFSTNRYELQTLPSSQLHGYFQREHHFIIIYRQLYRNSIQGSRGNCQVPEQKVWLKHVAREGGRISAGCTD